MATVAEWIEGARPRTLPTTVSPVLIGCGATIGGGTFDPWRALLALVVAVALGIGVNYANDYSDGIRGTDDERVGPLRLVGSRKATPPAVRNAAFACFAIAGLAGLTLVSLSRQWWLIGVGVACVLAAWFYTGGKRPYGYLGLGEVAVFVFYGPVAVLGTVITQDGLPGAPVVVASVGAGMLSCAVLVVNNLRDIPTDADVGKRTLAVLLGDHATRWLYVTLVLVPLVLSVAIAVRSWPTLFGLVAAPQAIVLARRVRSGVTGPDLVGLLARTGLLLLLWSVGTAVGLAVAGRV
ncbi:MAG: 1,4-dihydroxy-2-naphthoate polyprenyltransferase [Pseudonocardia sp.]|nr:1,4-dihydroxy-2-naphthoate polyprenyltransferase [Pseudonocardia sp.]